MSEIQEEGWSQRRRSGVIHMGMLASPRAHWKESERAAILQAGKSISFLRERPKQQVFQKK